MGCTTYSFAVNLACFFSHIPHIYPESVETKNGKLLPREYQGHFRRHLQKSIVQPELKRPAIWFIQENGGYLREVIDDAKSAIVSKGLPWFDRFNDLEEVMRVLLVDGEKDASGIGTKVSPIRNYLIGYSALALNNTSAATEHLQLALESGCFKLVENELRASLSNLHPKE